MVMINFLSIPFLLSIYLFFNKILLEIIAANMNKNPTINVKLIPKKSPLVNKSVKIIFKNTK